jgi:hypothetical protein
MADVTLETKKGKLEAAPRSLLSPPLLGAALPSIQFKDGENATCACRKFGFAFQSELGLERLPA